MAAMIYVDFTDYELGQQIKSCRVRLGYTQAELANKIGVSCWLILQYERGQRKIPTKRLYAIARAFLFSSIKDLLPKPEVFNEDGCFQDEVEEILNIAEIYKKTQDPELRKTIRLLIKSTRVKEKNSKEAEKAGSSVSQLSADKYDDIERTDFIDCKIGQRVREVRLIREYTQAELAEAIGVTRLKMYNYELGRVTIPFDTLRKIAKVLSVNVGVLLPKIEEIYYESKDSKAEVPSVIREFKKIESQKLRDKLGALIKSVSEE